MGTFWIRTGTYLKYVFRSKKSEYGFDMVGYTALTKHSHFVPIFFLFSPFFRCELFNNNQVNLTHHHPSPPIAPPPYRRWQHTTWEATLNEQLTITNSSSATHHEHQLPSMNSRYPPLFHEQQRHDPPWLRDDQRWWDNERKVLIPIHAFFLSFPLLSMWFDW